MKKIVLVFLASILVFSCQKKELKTVQIQQDVVFNVTQIDPGSGLKSTADWTCPTDTDGNLPEPVSAEIDIDDGTTTTTYSPAVFRLDGNLYTQAIKLTAAQSGPTTYTVTRFVLKDAGGTIIMATPITGSDYSEYVSQGVTFTFEVNAFAKAEVPVEVLCFLPEDYTNFGFDWFNVTEIVVREFCFFGDICLNGDPYIPEDYLHSLYDYMQDPLGTQPDMPAIFLMHVYDNSGEVPNSPFTNATVDANYGVGSPLCVQYPDKLNATGEQFTFDLYVLVKNAGGTFSYQPYYTFFSTDDGELMLSDGTTPADGDVNGVMDFVVGTCNSESSDLQLAWLPQVTLVTVREADLAKDQQDVMSDPSKWFFYNDETDVIDNTLGSFVPGPGSPPAGTGSAQISVTGTQRRNLATYQFSGIPLADITTIKFSTYNPSAGNGGGSTSTYTGYLNFNVDFDGSDTWQKRLIFHPTGVLLDTWQEWDAIQGGAALWSWSGLIGHGGSGTQWPDGNTNEYRTWNDIVSSFPNVRFRVTDSWFGIRVGAPYPSGYTENIDAIKFGTGSTFITYDFEN